MMLFNINTVDITRMSHMPRLSNEERNRVIGIIHSDVSHGHMATLFNGDIRTIRRLKSLLYDYYN